MKVRYRVRTVTSLAEIPLPFGLEEAKAHLRVDGTDEDGAIEASLRAAADHVERFTGQVLTARVMELALDGFPEPPETISVPREPVTGIVSIAYSDPSTGAEIAMAPGDWRWADTDADAVRPPFGAAFPRAAAEGGSVRIRFNAGYEEGLAPPALLQAVKLMLGHLYLNREAAVAGGAATELPLGVQALCAPFRRFLI